MLLFLSANNAYTVLYAFYPPEFTRCRRGGLAYCIKRESLSPHASGGEQTVSAPPTADSRCFLNRLPDGNVDGQKGDYLRP